VIVNICAKLSRRKPAFPATGVGSRESPRGGSTMRREGGSVTVVLVLMPVFLVAACSGGGDDGKDDATRQSFETSRNRECI